MKELHNKKIDLVVDVHLDNIKKNESIEKAIIYTGKIFSNITNPKEDIKKMRLAIDTLEQAFIEDK